MSKTPCVRNRRAQTADFIDALDLLSFDTGPNPALGDFIDLRNRDIAAVRDAFQKVVIKLVDRLLQDRQISFRFLFEGREQSGPPLSGRDPMGRDTVGL